MGNNSKNIDKQLNSPHAEPEAKRPSEISEEGGQGEFWNVGLRYFNLLIKCEKYHGSI